MGITPLNRLLRPLTPRLRRLVDNVTSRDRRRPRGGPPLRSFTQNPLADPCQFDEIDPNVKPHSLDITRFLAQR
jgi:hypothetical protein